MPLPTYEDVKRMKEEGSTEATFPVDQGSIHFTAHSNVRDPEFVRVRKGVDKSNLVRHAIDKWGIGEPGLLLRVTGSVPARDVALPLTVEGVATAAHRASAGSRYAYDLPEPVG